MQQQFKIAMNEIRKIMLARRKDLKQWSLLFEEVDKQQY